MRKFTVAGIALSALALTGCGVTVTVNDSPAEAKQDFIAYVEGNYTPLVEEDEKIVLLLGKEMCEDLNEYGEDWLDNFNEASKETPEHKLGLVILDSASRYLCSQHEDMVTAWLSTR